jgi:hypothetical protein
MVVEATDPAAGPRLIFHPAAEPETAKNRLQPVLITERHDEETERLTALGAKLFDVIELPKLRQSTFADPAGNGFALVTWQSE